METNNEENFDCINNLDSVHDFSSPNFAICNTKSDDRSYSVCYTKQFGFEDNEKYIEKSSNCVMQFLTTIELHRLGNVINEKSREIENLNIKTSKLQTELAKKEDVEQKNQILSNRLQVTEKEL